jgi:non-reducing end alpha-L-arabinofuranosidase
MVGLKLERAYVLALVLVATGSLVAAGPCDIYSSGGTPCVAAHSTTRALYSAYSGSLYQVMCFSKCQ